MQLCNRIYYSIVYWRLNMFRAAHRSSSGALNCICSLWFIYCKKVKANIELDKLIQHRNIINYVKAQRLSWYGHIYRKPETSIVKKIHKWQPYITRPVGRPKHRWDDVRNDLRKMKLFNGWNKPKTAMNGRKLSRKPRLYMSCSAY